MDKFKQYSAESKANYIPMEDLVPYFYYRIHARNSQFGIWLPDQKGFYIRREKFGDYFGFVEYHWDTGPPFGTVRPFKQLENTPFCAEDFEHGDWIHPKGHKYWGEKNYHQIMKYLKEKPEEYAHDGY